LIEEGVGIPDIPPPSMRSRVGEASKIRRTDDDDETEPGRRLSILLLSTLFYIVCSSGTLVTVKKKRFNSNFFSKQMSRSLTLKWG